MFYVIKAFLNSTGSKYTYMGYRVNKNNNNSIY